MLINTIIGEDYVRRWGKYGIPLPKGRSAMVLHAFVVLGLHESVVSNIIGIFCFLN